MKNFEKDTSKVGNKIKGTAGEIVSVDFLKKKGFRILETNFKNKIGEIDIIAKDKGVIVFVEVKRRATLAYGRPIEAVDFHKQNKIRMVAECYLMAKHIPLHEVRFDVIEIVGDTINHVENAF